jgi:outer membrane protein OmpA-like peptidoglycan-associated protein
MLAINTIYFDFDKSNIRESETEKLDKIVKVLNENPTLKIELGSHTDCRGTKGYNQALSQRRAQSTSNYIRKRITNPSRIVSKGYGESQLTNNCPCEGSVASDCNEEQHQLNRRTEFKIIGL